MYIECKKLPGALKCALASVRYFGADISVKAAETVSPFMGGGKGYRGFFVAVDLSTGERKITWGSWGGANMFNPGNRVDLDTDEYEMRPGFAVIKGTEGGIKGNCQYATISIGTEASIWVDQMLAAC